VDAYLQELEFAVYPRWTEWVVKFEVVMFYLVGIVGGINLAVYFRILVDESAWVGDLMTSKEHSSPSAKQFQSSFLR